MTPTFPRNNFLVRTISTELKDHRTLYYTSPTVQRVVCAPGSGRLSIVNMGVKCFGSCDAAGRMNQPTLPLNEIASLADGDGLDTVIPLETSQFIRPSNPCPFRIYAEGLDMLVPYLGARIVSISFQELIILLENQNPTYNLLSKQVEKTLSKWCGGSVVFKMEVQEEDLEFVQESIRLGSGDESLVSGSWNLNRDPVYCSAFNARFSVSLFVNNMEKKSLYHRLTGKELILVPDLPNIVSNQGEEKQK